MKRRILVLLLLLWMLVGTLSCGPAQNTDTTVGDGEETTDQGALIPPENLLTLASADLSDFVIIYPAAA